MRGGRVWSGWCMLVRRTHWSQRWCMTWQRMSGLHCLTWQGSAVFHRGKFHVIGGCCTYGDARQVREERGSLRFCQLGVGQGRGGFPGRQHVPEDLRGRWWHGDVHVSCGWGGGTAGLQMADSRQIASWDSPHSLHDSMGGEAVSEHWWSPCGVHVGFEESQVEEIGGAGGVLWSCSVRLLFGDLNAPEWKMRNSSLCYTSTLFINFLFNHNHNKKNHH